MILVYEYMPRGTLADHLYKLARKNNACSSLSWNQRLKICIGAGRGLDYLHTGQRIIHRDVKTSNILLDQNFVAKVSDFGLAKFGSGSESQSQPSTNLKGTFGYMDPDYFRTRKLTKKSDTYSFGVVLLEVLCGRPAVEPWVEEDKRSLTMWAQDKISNGEVDQIIDPSLRGEISPDSLKAFVSVAEKCLNDKPKKRPAMVEVVMDLKIALDLQEKAKSFAQTTIVEALLPVVSTIPLLPNEIRNIADAMPLPPTDKTQLEKAKSLSPHEITSVADALPPMYRNMLSVSTRQLTMASSNVPKVSSPLREQINSEMINAGKKDGGKTTVRKLLRFWPWDALRNTAKPSKKKDSVNFSKSAPISRRTSEMTLGATTVSTKSIAGSGEVLPTPNLRIFSFAELKAATRNFRRDSVLGEGGFGRVFKGWLEDESGGKQGDGSVVAIKKLYSASMQGFREYWQSEVNFLGRLSHPNLVKLLGYCWEDQELLLVYEFMQKGSLENHLFRRRSVGQPLPWHIRFKILIGAAHGLAFLHASEGQVIYRGFKASNILLDASYHAKLSDFGLAKLGPSSCEFHLSTHVSTHVIGTYSHAAPEYVATGHLCVKSDVYGFGVVLLEMLTGLRAVDLNRPSGQTNLVDWLKPYLLDRNRLKGVMDSRLERRYPKRCVRRVARLALCCLETEPKNRPSMQEIVEMLERIDSAVKNGRQPRVHFS
ncbi:Serine/threonine protein kinase [Handroanthus impetiginosus]|uniref:non-specific serine/threonine protein kinase n=1 Tax=Handroanthus impetiginosus TaxID=429701 RepID=A0A2G9HIE9_9LAMI|nr:Serine/threonine protein kinase [Handroanthus impetiginosus]